MIRSAVHGTDTFAAERRRLLERGATDLDAVEPVVRSILDDVRAQGDRAVLAHTERLERRRPAPLYTSSYEGRAALSRLPADVRRALELSAERIERFHLHEKHAGFSFTEDGTTLGLRVRPLARVGVYAPGGKARYPSSVLMSAIPARVAGVKEIVLATPAPNDLLLAAAYLSGVTAVLDAGGAQAIAALAYGTESVPRVDKIVGPGNRYVACAKRLVFGTVGIDGIAGPSEILVLADATADPAIIAADLLSQAEHDEAAYPLAITTEPSLVPRIEAALREQLGTLPRKDIAHAAITNNGVVFVVPDRETMARLADEIAAEHVALHVERPEALFEQIPSIGAAFVGHSTPEAAGDYLAGPSHVLPTGGAVRYGSPLGVHDFIARSSYIQYAPSALRAHGEAIATLARAEGLEAHARAVELRLR